MQRYGQFQFEPTDRSAFASGILRQAWFEQYPALFDEQDRILADHQPRNHFFEWLAAIKIFEDSGFLSLLEKYQFRNHSWKHSVFARLAPPDVVKLLSGSRYLGDRQGPDLFCYHPHTGDWYFCEVKGGNDRVRDGQSTTFALLERMTGKPVRLIQFVAPNPFRAEVDGA